MTPLEVVPYDTPTVVNPTPPHSLTVVNLTFDLSTKKKKTTTDDF